MKIDIDIDIAQLQAVLDILHLLQHRNKNQHRHSIWWQWMSMLKRCVGKLIIELTGQDIKHAQARVLYMRKYLIPKCYLSFAQVIQDSQFSALGLVLVAELAKTWRVIGFHLEVGETTAVAEKDPARSKSFAEPESEPLEDLGEAVGRSLSENPAPAAVVAPSDPGTAGNGETSNSPVNAICDAMGMPRKLASTLGPQGGRGQAARPRALPKIARKKRRKPANAIDDLFQDLG